MFAEQETYTATKSQESNEDSKSYPVWRCACDNSEETAYEKRHIKCESSANYISAHTPEQSSKEHTNVDSDCEGARIGGIEFIASLSGNDGL